ncbi:DUF1656 domain-containing protein [Microbulbifer yueqingensis]|uniref:DUF1656 domain-containing protein n=1 Tax=Microbulbifer yueqingensis TaxID=658219 RepID=A0A1G9ANK8_9GAMM|nr:Protein of unknown function [Microbulbifer yueqingensis]
MLPIPHEISLGGIYLPPLLLAAVLGFGAATMTARAFDHYRLSRYFASPPLVLIGMVIIYTLLFGLFFIGI